MLAYLKSHWRGQQTISRSFVINGFLIFLLLGAPLAMQPIEVWEEIVFESPRTLTLTTVLAISYLSVLAAWLGWFAVGTARSAVRTLSSGYGLASKILAIIALLILAAMLVPLAHDLRMLARWIRGVAASS